MEALGRITHSLFKTQFPQSPGDVKAQLLATGHWEGELVHTRRDGALVTVASSWTLQRDDSDRPVSIIEMNYDMSAEDNVVNQQVALGNLQKLGYKADIAASGIEVLDALQRKRYDIVLMDCEMPDLDGYRGMARLAYPLRDEALRA